MKKISTITKKIEAELKKSLSKIDSKKTEKFVRILARSKNIFVTGQGRSGLIGEAFAMRLMQIGKNAFIVGMPTTPAIKEKDIFVAISCTGKTKVTADIVKEAKKEKTFIVALTAEPNSIVASLADLVIIIKAKDSIKSKQPLATLFEQAALLYLDSVIIMLMQKLGIKEKKLAKRHANL